MNDTVLTGNDGPLRTITLNRPDKLNAFTAEMHLALRAALEAARDDESCRAVLLTGAGRGFCAGQDLGDRDPSKGELPDLGETLNLSVRGSYVCVRLHDPTIQGTTQLGQRNKPAETFSLSEVDRAGDADK